MRILIVAPYNSPIIKRLVSHLKDLDHNILVASHNIGNSEGFVNLGNLNSFFDYSHFFKVNKIVRDFKPDIVHAHIVNHYGLMCILQSKPMVVALWGSDVMLATTDGIFYKRMIFRLINWIVMKRAQRCHTSGFHVAEMANNQCKGVLNKTDIYYWGFPLAKPTTKDLDLARQRLKKEFNIYDNNYLVFPRGLSPVYNPDNVAKIVNKLINLKGMSKRIVVLKGFASEPEEKYFKSLINTNEIIYIDRLLNDDELYFLYSNTDIHFSIPVSDSLGGGVIEPALLGSYPVLSNLPSYRQYAEKNECLILNDFDDSTIDELVQKIHEGLIRNSASNIPKDYTLPIVMKAMMSTYRKAKESS